MPLEPLPAPSVLLPAVSGTASHVARQAVPAPAPVQIRHPTPIPAPALASRAMPLPASPTKVRALRTRSPHAPVPVALSAPHPAIAIQWHGRECPRHSLPSAPARFLPARHPNFPDRPLPTERETPNALYPGMREPTLRA